MRFFLRAAVLLATVAGIGTGAVTAAHADYIYNHKHYQHRQFVKDHAHPKGHYRYY